jgi:hypothetical protein
VNVARNFAGQAPGIARGLGGTHSYYVEPCEIFVPHVDGMVDRLHLDMRFARPSRANADLPSVLGADFLYAYRLTFEPAAGLVSLELRT